MPPNFFRGEFVNAHVEQLLHSHGIRMEHAYSNKASQIERLNLTIQRLIRAFLTQNVTNRYLDHLQLIALTYNLRHHRIIRMSPIEAEISSNRNRVIYNLEHYWQSSRRKKKVVAKFKIGDSVRIKKESHRFARGYQRTFARETFIIHEVHKHLSEIMYSLCEYDDRNAVIVGRFYENELTSYTSKLFKVIEVLEYSANGRDVKVLKEGHRFPSWIKTVDLHPLQGLGERSFRE